MRLSLQCQQLAWLAYGVHGNEISSTDAAMMTAYHLLAAEDDVTVRAIIGQYCCCLGADSKSRRA